MSKAPTTLEDLKKFYAEEFRPLYDRFISEGCIAQEIHTEMAAGADHLLLSQDQSGVSTKDCERASAHFKRATFDAFKIIYEKRVRNTYERLMDVQYFNVHDGNLHAEVAEKWDEAVKIAMKARCLESLSRKDDYDSWGEVFVEWKKILPIAEWFTNLMKSPEVMRIPAWDNARRRAQCRRAFGVNLGLTVFGAVIGAVLSLALSLIFCGAK